MEINHHTVAAIKTIITEPEEHISGLKPINEIFEESEEAMPKHLVYEHYNKILNDHCGGNMPKVMFYIVLDEMYKQGKAADGNLGYFVKIKL